MTIETNHRTMFKLGALFLYFFGLYHIGCIPNGGVLTAIVFFILTLEITIQGKECSILPDLVQSVLHWSIAGYGAYCLFT